MIRASHREDRESFCVSLLIGNTKGVFIFSMATSYSHKHLKIPSAQPGSSRE